MTIATSGDEAAIYLNAMKFDLVVTDDQMPGVLRGRDLAALIAREHPETKVVIVSGSLKKEECPPTATLLEKPFTKQALVAAMEGLQ